jgi:hypothetical protein
MIKLIDILKEITEGKQIGTLYRFITYKQMISIINDNFIIKAGAPYMSTDYLSFTRNKNVKSNTISKDVRITINGDELSNRYKIESYADTKAGYGKGTLDESEERIDLKKYPKGINLNLPNIIKKIDILSLSARMKDDSEDEDAVPPSLDLNKQVIVLLKEKNIPYNIVKKYD